MNYDPTSERSLRQLEGVQKWVDSGCRSTLVYCTGFGKTWVAILCIKRFLKANPTCHVDVIVPTDILYQQWTKLIDKEGLGLSVKVWIVNTAIMQNHDTDLLVIDEVHRFASDTFVKIFEKFGYAMVLGLTATFERLDGKERIISQYCPVVDEITIEEATAKGWLATSRIYKVMIDVDDIDLYKSYNRTFIDHFSYFEFDFSTAMACVSKLPARIQYVKQRLGPNYDSELYKKELKECTAHAFAWNKALNNRKQFIFKHPKKLEIAEKILSKRPNSKAITFNSTIEECEKFSHGYIVHSGKTKKINRLTIEEFNQMKTGVIHSSKALTEGVDVKGLNLAIILYNSSSATERIQKYGRVIRAEKGKVAEIFSLVIRGTVEETWFKSSAKNTEFIEINENELDDVLNNKSIYKQVQKQDTLKLLLTS